MLSLLFVIFFFIIFGKIIGFAFKATWSILKIMLFLVFMPAILVAMVVGGLVYIALPVLLIVGIISLFAKAA